MILSTFLFVICFGGLSTFCGMNKSRGSAKAKRRDYSCLQYYYMHKSRYSAETKSVNCDGNLNGSLNDRIDLNAEGLGIEDKVEPNSKNFIISLWDSIIMFFIDKFFALWVKYKEVCHYFSWGLGI